MSASLTLRAGAAALFLLAHAAPAQRLSTTVSRNPVVLRHANRVTAFDFAPDGKLLATVVSGTKSVLLWDPVAGRTVRTLPTTTNAGSVAFSPDGKWLAVSEQSGAVSLWSAQTWVQATGALLPVMGPNPGLSFGRLIAPRPSLGTARRVRIVLAAWFIGQVRVFELSADGSATPLYSLACSTTPPDPMDPYVPRAHTVLFARNGQQVATVCDHRITIWDAATGAQQQIIPAVLVEDAAFSPDSRLLARVRHAVADEPQVVVRVLSQSAEHTFVPPAPLPSPGFQATAFSPDGAVLAAAQWQTGNIALWNVATRAVIRTLSGHSKYVTHLQYSPDGSLLASGAGPDSTVRLWKMR